MFEIAIVEDSTIERKVVHSHIHKYFEQHPELEMPQLFEYESGECFLQEFVTKRFSIIVLDIYMGELTGMETAQRIRDIDKSVCIIFLTTSMEHVFMGYSVQATAYVPKPLADHEDLFNAGLTTCMEHLVPDTASIIVHVEKVPTTIYLREILYVDCQLRDACLHIVDGREFFVKESIGEVCSTLLFDKRFLECHRNTVINMEHIRSMSDENFQLKNEILVPFAQRRKGELRRIYMDFFMEQGRQMV